MIIVNTDISSAEIKLCGGLAVRCYIVVLSIVCNENAVLFEIVRFLWGKCFNIFFMDENQCNIINIFTILCVLFKVLNQHPILKYRMYYVSNWESKL